MYEIVAIATGVLIGLLVQGIAATWVRVTAMALGSVIVGAAVSFISGELRESWAYIIFDVSQVLIAAVLTVVCVSIWRQRPAR